MAVGSEAAVLAIGLAVVGGQVGGGVERWF